ncbi:carbohydrate binding domain-containing protein [Curtobacterium poinsettiae]|uniref:carbohydrate binding domain-containing protein n=1 Tax=Curtobacterium TaxID=2034 RepID=UPI00217D5860|nr:carbohydrate binding domain-containing protein [Curtobacterium flaccumfaciens]MCS6563428.1 carbohydrate binding domain-containing protein [Curtobacterium flaccumfaciens pv. poinsettiae]UXN30312.1 carbohydrate binding domain-containing protein [Curtobacterium flaccumfaciens]
MAVLNIVTTVGLVSPAGTTVATLTPLELQWTQDEANSPMFVARVVVAMPSALQYAMLRPGAGYYLSVAADVASTATSPPYLWKIVDRRRTADGQVELSAASAEVELQAYSPPAVDRSNWARQSSVPTILADVLTKTYGAGKWSRYTYPTAYGQDVGTPAYPTFEGTTNLCTNGGFEYGTTGWTGTYAAVSQSSAQRHTGTYSMLLTPNSGNQSRAALPQNLSTNTTYTLSAWVRSSAVMTGTAVADGRRIYVVGATAGTVARFAETPTAPNVANQWNRVSVTFTTPALMDSGSFELRALNGSTTAAPVNVWFDDITLVEGDGTETSGAPIDYFDGDTVDGALGYNYDWQGAAGNSSSTRTPIISRDPESLTWSPGQYGWDFLQPILQASGIRLWSDGYAVLNGAVVARYFWATNEFGYGTVAPRVLQGQNLLDLKQTDSYNATFPDGTPMYADQVIIHYTWTDALNIARDAYDVYPASGRKPYFLELADTPFAGVGRAQGIYNRISTRATMFEGTASFNRGLFPGMQVAITADVAGGSVLGYVDTTTHDPFRGTTDFRTKQTVAYTTKSWYSATGTWASQSGSWAAEG